MTRKEGHDVRSSDRLAAARNSLSGLRSFGRATCRRRMASSCRRTSSSTSSERSKPRVAEGETKQRAGDRVEKREEHERASLG